MGTLVVNLSLTLDGVVQAPGRPDEDTRGGFTHGGWAVPYFDPVMGKAAAEGMAKKAALLFGRRTYQDFYAVWPKRGDNPFTTVLNNSRKYVVSTTLKDPLPWQNSTLLQSDVAVSVARLKEKSDDLVVLGSVALVQSLMRHNLVDEYVFSIHPLVLGTGRRLFTDGSPGMALELVDSKTTTTGVVMAMYRPSPLASKPSSR
jgi:dihydrofolate reductase